MALPRPSPVLLAAVVALPLVLLPGVIAESETVTYHACVLETGTLRMVDEDTQCLPGETAVTWNQQGPPGEQGPQGPPGKNGKDGTDGRHGLVELEPEPAGETCPDGGHLLRAGFDGNRNGRLEPIEVEATVPVCHGATGPEGPAGPQGEPGPAGPTGPVGPQGTVGPSGTNCWDLDGDGVADAEEDSDNDGVVDVHDCRVDVDQMPRLLTIAGSSTVYEFSRVALDGSEWYGVPGFEAWAAGHGRSISVDLSAGGSSAGRQAVGTCLVDVGMSSSHVKESELAAWPDCDGDGVKDEGRELGIHPAGWDAVVLVGHWSFDQCFSGTPQFTQEVARALYIHNADDFGWYAGWETPSGFEVDTDGDGQGDAPLDRDGDGVVRWNEVPTDAFGGTCEGTEVVEIFDRSDPGGISEMANFKLFGQRQLQLEDWGVWLDGSHQGDGHIGVLHAVEASSQPGAALWFTSFAAYDDGLTVFPFGITRDSVVQPDWQTVKDQTYDATRPLLYLTVEPRDAAVDAWLDFVLSPERNQVLAHEAGFVSIY